MTQSSRDTQEPIAFHKQVWCKASSGGIFLIKFLNCSKYDELYGRRRPRLGKLGILKLLEQIMTVVVSACFILCFIDKL